MTIPIRTYQNIADQYLEPMTVLASSLERYRPYRPKSKKNENSTKQAAAKRARKMTKRKSR